MYGKARHLVARQIKNAPDLPRAEIEFKHVHPSIYDDYIARHSLYFAQAILAPSFLVLKETS